MNNPAHKGSSVLRILTLILAAVIVIIVVFSGSLPESYDYTPGSVAQTDIFAPRTFVDTYETEQKAVIARNSVTAIFIRSEELSEQNVDRVVDFFDLVQQEMERRNNGAFRYSGVSIFSSKVKCGGCGSWYGAKVWHSTDKYRRTIYRCNDKFKSHCKTPHLTEDDIKEAFVRAVNQLIENKADVLDSITLLKERLTDTEDLEEERDRISTDLNLLADKIQQLIAENARVAQNQDDYDRNYNELVSRYEAAKTQYDKTCEAIQYRKARSRQMDSFIKELRNQDLIKEFDARLWGSLVDFITVYSKDDIRVTFKDGTEIRA